MAHSSRISAGDRAFLAMLVVLFVLAPIACGVRDRIARVEPEACVKACHGHVAQLTVDTCSCEKR